MLLVLKNIWSSVNPLCRNMSQVCKMMFKQIAPVFLDPQPQLEGSYKIGSIHPSFHLSISFHRIGLLVSFWNLACVRGPYLVMCDRAGFFGKNYHQIKMTRYGQKRPKNMVFGLFKKVTSLFLSGICVKWKFL